MGDNPTTRLEFSTCSVLITKGPSEVDVAVLGEVDMNDSDRVAEVLLRAASTGSSSIVVELGGLTFADSSAIRALLTGRRAAQERDISFRIANPRHEVFRVLELAGLLDTFDVVDVVDVVDARLSDDAPPGS